MESLLREESRSLAQDDKSDKREEDEEGNEVQPTVEEDRSRIPAPHVRKQGNTGPKGVLADYAEHVEKERMRREVEQLKTEWQMKKMAITALTSREEEELKKKELQEQLEEENAKENDEKEIEEEEDDDDDEFFMKYKAKRYMMLFTSFFNFFSQITNRMAEIQSSQNPTFGFLRQITQKEYVDEIDNELSNVFVVIHLYQPVRN